jgi:adenosylcobinamide-GDP ribazoletransferase
MKPDAFPGFLREVVVAAVLLTRLPMPHLPADAFENGSRAVWAYPLIGLALGGLAALGAQVALAIGMPEMIAAGLCLAILMLSTGAMHEDGLADCADGFWGGYTAERRLEIMKDSRIGTYGVLALVMMTGLRWGAMALLLPLGAAAIVVAAVLSRAAMPVVMSGLPYARAGGLAVRVGKPKRAPLALSVLLALAVALGMLGGPGLIAVGAAIAATVVIALVARWKIGGYSGDVLGATQQIVETAVLCSLLVVLT